MAFKLALQCINSKTVPTTQGDTETTQLKRTENEHCCKLIQQCCQVTLYLLCIGVSFTVNSVRAEVTRKNKRWDNKGKKRKRYDNFIIFTVVAIATVLEFRWRGWKVKDCTVSSEGTAIKSCPFMWLRNVWEGERLGFSVSFCWIFLSLFLYHSWELSGVFYKYVPQADVYRKYCWWGFLPYLSAFLLNCNLK